MDVYNGSVMYRFRTLLSKILKKLRLNAIRNSYIDPTSKVESGSNLVNVTMLKYSFCGYNCDIMNAIIGSFCSIANNVVIGGAMHPVDWVSTSPVFYGGRDSVRKKFSNHCRPEDLQTIIGNDVWIGEGAKIKQGVRVGTGAVIGMGAVVTKDVPPYAIVAGNPAKLIRMRFDDETVARLLDSQWWNLPEEKLSGMAQYIMDPQRFIAEI